jgi:Fe-S cluster assembly protein SufD
MTPIHVTTDIQLPEGYSEYEINTDRDIELTFTAKQDCDAFIRILNTGKLRIRTFAAKGVKVNYLFWNLSENTLDVDESHEVMGDANVTVAYGEINRSDTIRNVNMALREEGATGLLSSASLVDCVKTYNMNVVNYAPHTYGDMKNYAVVLGKGRLMIDAVGKIIKGAYRSESHQTSRALSFEDGQNATILPELLIDEDDVQASHAMSMGRVDEDALYYLMSRGLSVQQCTSLISQGYLMPITETLDNEELKEKLKAEMERKMDELC